ncbi:hypothetical protein HPB50_001985 [Hyalomma asiaticum]|uniref:Uncharacterized protein n=1 Tax=Hyalomma asiaticum TaxID=266040 RepID=A0ACB7RLV6_HYAAI|nr:hypothetical protein HPB50_001985 [Hyalomma asiaticum]
MLKPPLNTSTFDVTVASEANGCSLDQLQTPFGVVSGTAVGDHVPGAMQSMLPEFDPYMPAVTTGPQNVRPPGRQQEAQAGDLMYMCDVCPLEFQRKGQLKIHRLSHIGKKPFKCTFCRYVTADKSDLAMQFVCQQICRAVVKQMQSRRQGRSVRGKGQLHQEMKETRVGALQAEKAALLDPTNLQRHFPATTAHLSQRASRS